MTFRQMGDGGPMTTLQLVDSKTTGNGLVILTYAPTANDTQEQEKS
jgi:hypothetical protein